MRLLACLAVLFVAGIAPARGQERRVAVSVDYIAGADVYVALGARDGLLEGDSLPVYSAAGERRGLLLARIVTVRRAVLAFAGARFPVAAGDTLWLGLLRPVPPAPPPTAIPAGAPPPAQSVGERSATARRRPARVDGRIGIELDAVRTDAFEGGSETYATPTLRLFAVASDLPGGLRLSTNLRAARFATVGALGPVTSVRIYEAVVEKQFTGLPLRLQAGRFTTPLEPFGGFWDGALARLGGERFGVGAVAGFLPGRADERFSSDVPRASAFADFHARGATTRYDAELGFHALRPRSTYVDQTFVGFAQRVRWQGLWLNQSLQVDRNAGSGWTLSMLQLGGTVPLGAGLSARASGSRYREPELPGVAALPSYERDRASVGVSWVGSFLTAFSDVSRTRRGDGRTTSAVSGALLLPRTIAGFGLAGSASRSDGATFRSSYYSGELTRTVGRALVRAGYHSTSYQGVLPGTRTSQGADITFDLPLAGRTRALFRLETWWGDAGGARDRAFTSLSTGF